MESLKKASQAYLDTADGAVAGRLHFLEGLWEVQYASHENPQYETAARESAEESLVSGQPLFLLSPVSIPVREYKDMVRRVSEYVARSGVLPQDQSETLVSTELSEAIESHWDLVGSRPAEFIAAAAQQAASEGLSAVTAAFVLQSALVPFVRDAAHAAIESLSGMEWQTWGSGDCPVCGSPAAMAMMGESNEHKGASRTLWCSVCDAEWGYERLRCIRCGTRDASKLHYSYREEDPSHRAHLCDECKGYVKVLFVDDTDKPIAFPVEDAVSAEMDAVARSEGYDPEPFKATESQG